MNSLQTPERRMNEGRARDREQRGQMTSPEQRRQRAEARRSLNTIRQPQFQTLPDPPLNDGQQRIAPLYRGGVYYPGLHAGFTPRGVTQPLPMHAYLNLPQNAVANHQCNVGNHQGLAAAHNAQNWNEFNQTFQQSIKQGRPSGLGSGAMVNHPIRTTITVVGLITHKI